MRGLLIVLVTFGFSVFVFSVFYAMHEKVDSANSKLIFSMYPGEEMSFSVAVRPGKYIISCFDDSTISNMISGDSGVSLTLAKDDDVFFNRVVQPPQELFIEGEWGRPVKVFIKYDEEKENPVFIVFRRPL